MRERLFGMAYRILGERYNDYLIFVDTRGFNRRGQQWNNSRPALDLNKDHFAIGHTGKGFGEGRDALIFPDALARAMH